MLIIRVKIIDDKFHQFAGWFSPNHHFQLQSQQMGFFFHLPIEIAFYLKRPFYLDHLLILSIIKKFLRQQISSPFSPY